MESPNSPVVGLAEAAALCKVSPATIRRRKAVLVELGATTDPSGWRIPIPALVQVGLLDRVTPAPVPGSTVSPDTTPPIDNPQIRLLETLVAQLQDALEREKARCDAAEERAARAEERLDHLLPGNTDNNNDNNSNNNKGILSRLFGIK